MEQEQTAHHPNYIAVWIGLMALMGIQFGMSELGVADASYMTFVVVLFGVSVVKSLLVALYFMHMKFDRLLIHSLAAVPFYFLILLWIVIFYDLGN